MVLKLSGVWKYAGRTPEVEDVMKQVRAANGCQNVVIDASGLAFWDTSLVSYLWKFDHMAASCGISVDTGGCPDGVRRLLDIARASGEQQNARTQTDVHYSFLYRIGRMALGYARDFGESLRFIGEITLAAAAAAAGKARFRARDLLRHIQSCSVDALPIVTLISFLVGLILAFIGAIQLRMFGAQIYVANLVGIAMVRVIGAVMTGVIMAGRTGASFAAELGTMQVNDEIDALRTAGISPIEFLVLPRMIAVTLMMPLLCLYADCMGIAGGMFVGVCILDINITEFYVQTTNAVSLVNVWIGLFHSAVFGMIVGFSGCLRGMQCGRSSESVGTAATSAVVTAVLYIVIATAVITFVCNVLGI